MSGQSARSNRSGKKNERSRASGEKPRHEDMNDTLLDYELALNDPVMDYSIRNFHPEVHRLRSLSSGLKKTSDDYKYIEQLNMSRFDTLINEIRPYVVPNIERFAFPLLEEDGNDDDNPSEKFHLKTLHFAELMLFTNWMSIQKITFKTVRLNGDITTIATYSDITEPLLGSIIERSNDKQTRDIFFQNMNIFSGIQTGLIWTTKDKHSEVKEKLNRMLNDFITNVSTRIRMDIQNAIKEKMTPFILRTSIIIVKSDDTYADLVDSKRLLNDRVLSELTREERDAFYELITPKKHVFHLKLTYDGKLELKSQINNL